MSVRGIELWENGVIVTLKKGWFACDEKDLDVLGKLNWCMVNGLSNSYIEAYLPSRRCGKVRFHQQLALKYLGGYVDCIDHYNCVGFDNRDSNLNVVSFEQNLFKTPSTGYFYDIQSISRFHSKIQFKGEIFNFSAKSEFLVLCKRFEVLSQSSYWEEMKYFSYNPARDMRFSLDLLCKEIYGVVTKDRAYHIRLTEVAKNPWYIYRYGLEEDCKLHNITIPDFIEDKLGFMCNKDGNRLCPTLPKGFSREGLF